MKGRVLALNPKARICLPIQLSENNKGKVLSDSQTVSFLTMKDTMSIADSESAPKGVLPRSLGYRLHQRVMLGLL